MRRLRWRSFLTLALVGGFASAGAAPCIWDRDTLKDELRGLPEAFALVTGRWFTHGDAYYKRRIATLPGKIRNHPDALELYDDLAVAHERLQDRDAAIAVMEQKAAALARAAKAGRKDYKIQAYRYHANLGTFYAHAGRLAEAVVELEKAVALHRDAHFGRERFQIDLIRYILAARKDPKLWTSHNFLTFSNYQMEKKGWRPMLSTPSFTTRIQRHRDRKRHRWTKWEAAYTAVVGMLRFGGLEGAELYRVAGDLFAIRRDLHLAWWSYRRAIERGHPAAKRLAESIQSIETHWREARKHAGNPAPPTVRQYQAVRAECVAWRRAFWRAEESALTKGQDPGEPAVLTALIDAADAKVPPKLFRVAAGGRAKTRVQEQRAPAKKGAAPAARRSGSVPASTPNR